MLESMGKFAFLFLADFCGLLVKLAFLEILQYSFGKDFAGKLADKGIG